MSTGRVMAKLDRRTFPHLVTIPLHQSQIYRDRHGSPIRDEPATQRDKCSYHAQLNNCTVNNCQETRLEDMRYCTLCQCSDSVVIRVFLITVLEMQANTPVLYSSPEPVICQMNRCDEPRRLMRPRHIHLGNEPPLRWGGTYILGMPKTGYGCFAQTCRRCHCRQPRAGVRRQVTRDCLLLLASCQRGKRPQITQWADSSIFVTLRMDQWGR